MADGAASGAHRRGACSGSCGRLSLSACKQRLALEGTDEGVADDLGDVESGGLRDVLQPVPLLCGEDNGEPLRLPCHPDTHLPSGIVRLLRAMQIRPSCRQCQKMSSKGTNLQGPAVDTARQSSGFSREGCPVQLPEVPATHPSSCSRAQATPMWSAGNIPRLRSFQPWTLWTASSTVTAGDSPWVATQWTDDSNSIP